MITKTLPCDKCGKIDITGKLACIDQRLCPVCFAKQIKENHIDKERIRGALEKMMTKQGKDVIGCVVLKAAHRSK